MMGSGDFGTGGNTSQIHHKIIRQWRVVQCHNTSQKNKRLWWEVATLGSVTIHHKRIKSYEGKWWGREAVRKGSGEEGKRWRREMVTKGNGDEGKWSGREVVTKGRGDEGKWWGREVWWRREVVTKGSGDDGKSGLREVMMKGMLQNALSWLHECSMGYGLWEAVRKGSGEREVVTKGSGDEGKWWGEEVVTKGSGDEGTAAKCIVMAAWMLHGLCFGEEAGAQKLCIFLCQVAAAGDERYLLCGAGAVWIVSRSIGSSSVFCNEWLFLCA